MVGFHPAPRVLDKVIYFAITRIEENNPEPQWTIKALHVREHSQTVLSPCGRFVMVQDIHICDNDCRCSMPETTTEFQWVPIASMQEYKLGDSVEY